MSLLEQEKSNQGSNSKYAYLNNNNSHSPGKDHLKLKHFYNYESVKLSPKKNSLNSTMNLTQNYSSHVQNQHKKQKLNHKNQLFDSRLSFQRHSPSYQREKHIQLSNSIQNKKNKQKYKLNVEFSPFEDNQMIEKLFVQELQVQYQLIKNQLKEYQYQNELLRQKIKNLQNSNQIHLKSLQKKNEQLLQIQNISLIQKEKYEILLLQLKRQIESIKTSNLALLSESQKYQLQIHHLTNQLLYKNSTQNLQIQKLYKQNSQIRFRQPGLLYLRRQLNLRGNQNQMFKRKKSMPGKLLNKTYLNLDYSQNKIQKEIRQNQIEANFNEKLFLKYQHLIDSIKNMYKKIQTQKYKDQKRKSFEQIDLRFLWKWLKKLGHCYSNRQNLVNQIDL